MSKAALYKLSKPHTNVVKEPYPYARTEKPKPKTGKIKTKP